MDSKRTDLSALFSLGTAVLFASTVLSGLVGCQYQQAQSVKRRNIDELIKESLAKDEVARQSSEARGSNVAQKKPRQSEARVPRKYPVRQITYLEENDDPEIMNTPEVADVFVQTDVREAIQSLANQAKASTVIDEKVAGVVSATINNEPFELALRKILLPLGLHYRYHRGQYFICSADPESAMFSLISKRRDFHPMYTSPEDLIDMLPEKLQLYVRLAKSRNMLIVEAPDLMADQIYAELDSYDQPIPQVVLEAVVVVVSPECGFQFGFDIAQRSTVANQDYSLSLDSLAFTGSFSGGVANDLFSRFSTTTHFLRALEQEGYLSIRATPHVMARNGEKAEISINRETFFSTQPLNSNFLFRQDIQKVEAGIALEITPTIRGDNVTMVIDRAEVSENIRSNINDPALADPYPLINRRKVSTTVNVRDGETVTIGGLVQNQMVDRVSRVPILGNLPLIGKLFQKIEREEVAAEVVVFISPKIVPQEEVAPRLELPDTATNSILRGQSPGSRSTRRGSEIHDSVDSADDLTGYPQTRSTEKRVFGNSEPRSLINRHQVPKISPAKEISARSISDSDNSGVLVEEIQDDKFPGGSSRTRQKKNNDSDESPEDSDSTSWKGSAPRHRLADIPKMLARPSGLSTDAKRNFPTVRNSQRSQAASRQTPEAESQDPNSLLKIDSTEIPGESQRKRNRPAISDDSLVPIDASEIDLAPIKAFSDDFTPRTSSTSILPEGVVASSEVRTPGQPEFVQNPSPARVVAGQPNRLIPPSKPQSTLATSSSGDGSFYPPSVDPTARKLTNESIRIDELSLAANRSKANLIPSGLSQMSNPSAVRQSAYDKRAEEDRSGQQVQARTVAAQPGYSSRQVEYPQPVRDSEQDTTPQKPADFQQGIPESSPPSMGQTNSIKLPETRAETMAKAKSPRFRPNSLTASQYATEPARTRLEQPVSQESRQAPVPRPSGETRRNTVHQSQTRRMNSLNPPINSQKNLESATRLENIRRQVLPRSPQVNTRVEVSGPQQKPEVHRNKVTDVTPLKRQPPFKPFPVGETAFEVAATEQASLKQSAWQEPSVTGNPGEMDTGSSPEAYSTPVATFSKARIVEKQDANSKVVPRKNAGPFAGVKSSSNFQKRTQLEVPLH